MILLLTACAGAPQESLTWREHIEMLGLLDGQGVLDARITVGNTGTLRGQGRLRIDRWSPEEVPIQFSQLASPEQTRRSGEGIEMLEDGIVQSGDRWQLRVVDEGLSGLVELEPYEPGRAEAAWMSRDGQWTVAAEVRAGRLSGWLSAGERGGAARGVGLLMHRGGDGRPSLPRQAVYVLDRRAMLGVDEHDGEALRWAVVNGETVDAASLTVEWSETPRLSLPAAGLTATVTPWGWDGWSDPLEHLVGIEALLASPVTGRPMRRIRAARVDITISGERFSGSGLLVDVLPGRQVPESR